ncbi:uncharacterized protein K489DRAFT_189388 [Dissoconium aciculare CBS 342.82]|uniref:Uncharacterized protein n=1 Tax=Dissoconium aciculare CBS 342.82 TaxID=1314786 RepID=A0A6J3M9M9_9PEZI|nr:uncharacterized protein K489DRAFT_189388 [Dissoconium aciculare CBS 342.82]KAF1824756.1 hypothetical protein K489DRAFT_189388 [Dissoconium aciculare CBS 342.82]
MGFFSKKGAEHDPNAALAASCSQNSLRRFIQTRTSRVRISGSSIEHYNIEHRNIDFGDAPPYLSSRMEKCNIQIALGNLRPQHRRPSGEERQIFPCRSSPLKGFVFQIVRGWDINLTRSRPFNPIDLGWCQADLITDTPTASNQLVKDSIPRDRFEEILASIPAPGKSMRSASTSVASSSRQKAELSDCQWWTTQCIGALVDQGYLISCPKGLNKGKDPRVVLSESPRN